MKRNDTDVILSRRDWLRGRTVEAVGGGLDSEGHPWTVLTLDDGREVHISDDMPWVLVEPQIQ